MSALLLALCMSGCTIASETDIAALGAGLGNLPAAALPTIPKKKLPYPTPELQPLCGSKPDLAAVAQTADNKGYKDWLYVCTSVRNNGGVAWSSNAAQISVQARASVTGSTVSNAGGIASLAPSASVNKCGWMKVPGLLRMGHSTPQWGECAATLTVTSQFVFDPDILSDGNTANDDCLSTNNKRSTAFNYMQACPW
jgi:hypothetical protein